MKGKPKLTTCCLINHYNYRDFVREAVASAVEQTHPFDEILVVDDGSSEEHLEEVRRVCAEYDAVRLIEKKNGGQLSCFEVGVAESTADVAFFLDADDVWDPRYVESVMKVFAEHPEVEFVACNERRFFPDGRSEVTPRQTRDLGYSFVRALKNGGAFVGQPTSCLAIKRRILDDIFPLPQARGWRTCADEALVYGSSVVGARKYFLGEPLVGYRIHGTNHWFGKKYCPKDRLLRGREVQRLVEVLRLRQGLPISMANLAHHEFRTIEGANKNDYTEYQRLVGSSQLSFRRKLRIRLAIFAWYRLGKRI
ncbi:Hyaluronan synthase [Planctomycetes bacterium Poly30]|uniref:Hyaluronan synthase n=1 Tax=Saltatorellus ferox TaxID=2528018 RepID=A0A518EZZ2_9BACT|nr:Hyaluronan synthase [Planctomycetes bacterium Poly30]